MDDQAGRGIFCHVRRGHAGRQRSAASEGAGVRGDLQSANRHTKGGDGRRRNCRITRTRHEGARHAVQERRRRVDKAERRPRLLYDRAREAR